ncbi:hypothetical protein CDO73_02570 [Saccharibacillus sp. O23]|uniref:DUF2750 domain-containing protein n=1 Tax=Saccharibacillus sp. O23 TaxID=2009338 RepID=UPI000B4E054A|nr:DUF2750 domain-containing protein [Saccharibacillus sp. O23]OWR32506.1 hypothetical protein CDO73_02570 [Saccharibacillus sp. O23]
MDTRELEAMVSRPADVRYKYFVKRVVDEEIVWGLFEDGWMTTQDEKGNRLVPFWPKKEFAKHCAINDWQNGTPKSIDLYEFIETFLPDMYQKGYKASIFYNNEDSIVIKMERLLADLETELEKY